MTEKYSKKDLFRDIKYLEEKSLLENYLINRSDFFALGYLAGKYGLDRFIRDKTKLKKACDEYDETDDLMLLDTIKECLIDLEIIKIGIKNDDKR